MIFQHTIEQVLAGTKTQTRRVVKPGQYFRVSSGAVFESGRRKYEVGRIYAVQQARGAKIVAYIRITCIRLEHVQDIRPREVAAEGITPIECGNCDGGFDTAAMLDKFIQLWDSIQPKGRRWDDNPLVWCLEFELVKEASKVQLIKTYGGSNENYT